jgi:PilZ domain
VRVLGIGRRRREDREEISRFATLSSDGHMVPVSIVNLSPNGVSILTKAEPQPDQRYILTYSVGELEFSAELDPIRWTKDEQGFEWGCRRKVLSKHELPHLADELQAALTYTTLAQEHETLTFSDLTEDTGSMPEMATRNGASSSEPTQSHDTEGWRSLVDRGPGAETEAEPSSTNAITDDEFSEPMLRRLLAGIHDQIMANEASLPSLKEAQRQALEKHDKSSLDTAWAEHEARLQELTRLRRRSDEIRQKLVRVVEAELVRWRTKAEDQVHAWRDDRQKLIDRLLNGLEEIDQLLRQHQLAPRREAEERHALLAELEALDGRDLPLTISHPEIDWNVSLPDDASVLAHIERVFDTCRTIFRDRDPVVVGELALVRLGEQPTLGTD